MQGLTLSDKNNGFQEKTPPAVRWKWLLYLIIIVMNLWYVFVFLLTLFWTLAIGAQGIIWINNYH